MYTIHQNWCIDTVIRQESQNGQITVNINNNNIDDNNNNWLSNNTMSIAVPSNSVNKNFSIFLSVTFVNTYKNMQINATF